MRRKLFSIATGTIVFFALNLITGLFSSSIKLAGDDSLSLSLILVVSGVVTGYIARSKGWLYGGLMGILPYFLFFLGIGFFILFTLMYVNFKGYPYTAMDPFIDDASIRYYSVLFFRVIVLSAVGGFIGEKIYRLRKSKS